MSWWTLLGRRTGWSPGVGAGVVAVLALTALLVATVAVAGPAVVTAGLQERFAAAPPAQRGVEVSARQDAAAPGPQDEVARRLLTGALAPLQVRVERLREGELLPLADRPQTRLVPWTGEDVRTHAALTAGRWPAAGSSAAALEGTLHAAAAAALGVGAGDTVRLAPPGGAAVAVTVVGLWAPRDADDPFWRSQPLPLQGLAREGVRGPLLLDEVASQRLAVTWIVRWRAAPRPADIRADVLAPMAASVAGLRGAVAGLPTGGGPSAGADTELSGLLDGLSGPLRAADGAVRTLLVLLVTVAFALCLLLGSSLAQVRTADDDLLRARGAGGAARLLLGLREGVVWALLAAVPAAVLAPVVVASVHTGRDTGRDDGSGGGPGSAVLAALVCTAVVAGVLVVVAVLAGRRGRRAGRPGEALPVRRPTLLVVTVAAAAAAWQLRSAEGLAPDDPVLVLAVAVLLATASLLVVVALAALARPAARVGGRAGPVLALAGWHAGRRGLQPVAAVAVVVLCAAGGVCLLAARQSGRDAAVTRAHLEVAPEVAVAVPVAQGTPVEAGAAAAREATRRLAALPGVAAVSPVVTVDGAIGSSGPVRVLAVDRALLARLTAGAEPAAVTETDAALLGDRSGNPLPPSVPAILPAALAGALSVSAGQEIALEDVAGRRLTLAVAGVPGTLPADPFRSDGTPVVLVDAAELARAEAAAPLPPIPRGQPRPAWPPPPRAARQWWVVPADGADPARVAAAALGVVRPLAVAGGPAPVATTRAATEQRFLDEPVTRGLGRLALLGASALTLAGAGALLLGQLASTRRRRGELAVLRAIGLSAVQARRLALAEALLVGGMAVVAGVLLGVGLARWSAGQLSGLGAAATGGAPLAAPAAVLAVLGAAVLVVAAVRARAAVTADVPGVVREQVT